MAVVAYMYGKFLMTALNEEIDILDDDIKIMLCTSSYTPSQDTHQYKSDITNEVTGTGYTTGGISLTNKTLTYSTGYIYFDADNPEWTTSIITARYAVIYNDTPATDATKPLIGYIDFGKDEVSDGGYFRITFNESGIMSMHMS